MTYLGDHVYLYEQKHTAVEHVASLGTHRHCVGSETTPTFRITEGGEERARRGAGYRLPLG